MVGCWLCQCEASNSEQEYQRHQPHDAAESTNKADDAATNNTTHNNTGSPNAHEQQKSEGRNPEFLCEQQPKPGTSTSTSTSSVVGIHNNNIDKNSSKLTKLIESIDIEAQNQEEEEDLFSENNLPPEEQSLLGNRANSSEDDELFDNNRGGNSDGILQKKLPFLKKLWKKS